MKFKVGDRVQVRTGKDKGKIGQIAKILPKKGRVLVDQVNKKVKHQKARDGEKGQRVEFFAPIDISNISVVDENQKPSRIGYQTENGQKVRIFRTTKKPISAAKIAEKNPAAK